MDVVLSFLITLAIIFIVPIVIYGLFSSLFGLKEPDKKLGFLFSVLIQKIGTSIGFAWLFYLSRDYFGENWLLYAMVWIIMFAIVEVGQAMTPGYSKKEAVAGIISEIIYFPLAAVMLSKLLA
jgi:hypothetical protein